MVGIDPSFHHWPWQNCFIYRENQLPPWVNSSLTANELDSALKNHIKNVLDHYRGKLYAFDIVVCSCTRPLVKALDLLSILERNDIRQ